MYYPKLVTRWVPALYNLPRWFKVNQIPNLFDAVADAPTHTPIFGLPPIPITPDTVPAQFVLPNTPTNQIAPSLQAYAEVLTNSLAFLQTDFDRALQAATLFDVSDTQFVWLVEHTELIDKLEILLDDGTYHTIKQASSLHNLFNWPDMLWYAKGTNALISGLGYREYQSVNISSWNFLSYALSDGPTYTQNVNYVSHPDSKNWIPVHPTSIHGTRLPYLSEQPLTYRSPYFFSASTIPVSFTVRINSTTISTAHRTPVWNSVDERGLLLNIKRLPNELNNTYGSRLLQVLLGGDQTLSGLLTIYSAALGTGTLNYSNIIQNHPLPLRTSVSRLVGLEPDDRVISKAFKTSDPYIWRLSITGHELLAIYVNDMYVDFTTINASAGLIKLNANYDATANVICFSQRKNYILDGGFLRFSDWVKLPYQDYVLASRDIKVQLADKKTLRKSYRKNSPIYRWQSNAKISSPKGQAQFL